MCGFFGGHGDRSVRRSLRPPADIQLFFPSPNNLRRNGFKMGGDFTTTIFISALSFRHLFGISICDGIGTRERRAGSSIKKVLPESSTFKNPTEPCIGHLETLLVARRHPILHFTAPNVRDTPI